MGSKISNNTRVHGTIACAHQRLDLLEVFAGQKAVTRAARAAGRIAIGIEINDDMEYMDVMSAKGYAFVLAMGVGLRAGAQAVMAPVCSSWTWMNRGTSQRSLATPLGDMTKDYARNANAMVVRVILLCLLCMAKGVMFMLEQPRHSLMETHPCFQWLVMHHKIWRVSIQMGRFGGETKKPTWVYSAHRCVLALTEYACSSLPRSGQKQTAVRTHAPDGQILVCGGCDLKGTQSYPWGFGRAVTQLYVDHKDEIFDEFNKLRDAALGDVSARIDDLFTTARTAEGSIWHDADLESVHRFLLGGR